MIVCVAGCKGAGKDTLCDYLVRHHGFKKFAFADALKRVALKLIHAIWPDQLGHITEEDMYSMESKEMVYPEITFAGSPFSIRWFLQYLGTDVIRVHLDKDVWVKTVVRQVKAALTEDPTVRICISDCRFENEVSVFKTNFPDVKSVRVVRGNPAPPRGSIAHISEAQTFPVDIDVPNAGSLQDLYNTVDRLILSP